MTLTVDQVLAERLNSLLARWEALLPAALEPPDWLRCRAFRWRRFGQRGALQPVRHPHSLRLADLQRIDRQKAAMDLNTRQFLAGHPATMSCCGDHAVLGNHR
jgi:predicted AAA+ superfamily ATPase